MTANQISRIYQAITETETIKAKEMRYSPQFRKAETLEFCDSHIAKLRKMLAEDAFPVFEFTK